MRWIVGGKAAQRGAASPNQMGRFETQWLAAPKNFAALADLAGQWIDLVHGRRPRRGTVLDMDLSVSPTHGERVRCCCSCSASAACRVGVLSRRDNTSFASREKSGDSSPSAIIV